MTTCCKFDIICSIAIFIKILDQLIPLTTKPGFNCSNDFQTEILNKATQREIFLDQEDDDLVTTNSNMFRIYYSLVLLANMNSLLRQIPVKILLGFSPFALPAVLGYIL